MDEHPCVGGALRLSFFPSHLVAEEAAAVFAEHEGRIRERLPDAEIRHTGGTSVLGVLTAGDVDLQVRTDWESFEAANRSRPGPDRALYNALKRAYEGGSYDEYQAAKRDFFYANFRL